MSGILWTRLLPLHQSPSICLGFMLKMTEVKLELITDKDIYSFLENNIRGGLSIVNHREFTANNKYLDDYDPTKPSSFGMYIDANNLYGCSMIGNLPTNSFKWLQEPSVKDLDINQCRDFIMNLDPEGDTMYVFEMDGEYPEHLHDSHNDYPMAIESKTVVEDQLSPYNQEFLKDDKERFVPTRKLNQDFHDKKNYVCSLKNLQFFLLNMDL